MRIGIVPVLFATAALAACGGGLDNGKVKFSGLTPNTSLQKAEDNRQVTTSCAACGRSVEMGTPTCYHVIGRDAWCAECRGRDAGEEEALCLKGCDAEFNWKPAYTCGFCNGTAVCRACVMMEQDAGQCYNCKGEKVLIYAGKTVDCPDCKGNDEADRGKCPVCKGTRKCDYCEGRGQVPSSVIKDRAVKPADFQEAAAAPVKEAPALPPAEAAPAPAEKGE